MPWRSLQKLCKGRAINLGATGLSQAGSVLEASGGDLRNHAPGCGLITFGGHGHELSLFM